MLKFLGSPALALWLLVFVGAWSIAATVVPQSATSAKAVAAWAGKYGALEPVVRVVGLHKAFTSPIFIIATLLLALSTGVCSWNRTKFALVRGRRLREAAQIDEASLAARHDIEIPCAAGLSVAEATDRTADTLAGLGIKSERRGRMLVSVSPTWSAWGSPVFHWALLALIVAALLGVLTRSEGSIALYVGQTKPDAPASYISVSTGLLHNWRFVRRSIRLDAFEPDLKLGGIDRGAVPTVSVLDGAGKVLVTQRVYPNSKLHTGSLSINAPEVGLAINTTLLDGSGNPVAKQVQFAGFSQTTSGGTVPQSSIASRDSQGNPVMYMEWTVPLDKAGNQYGEWIPAQPKARVLILGADKSVILDQVVNQGQTAALPGGGSVRLDGLGWYSRLSLVDDPTIPLVYASMILAALGLTLSLVSRQQLMVATVLERPKGAMLVMNLRLWRNIPTSRGEIEAELGRVLGSDSEGSES